MKILKAIGAYLLKLISRKPTVIVALPEIPGATKEILEADLEHAIQIVNNIKAVMESPGAVIITSLIPGTIDNTIREKIVSGAPQLVAGLLFAKHLLDEPDDANKQLADLLKRIKFSDKPDQDALWHNMAARMLMMVSDGKVTWSEAVMAVEYYFRNVFFKT